MKRIRECKPLNIIAWVFFLLICLNSCDVQNKEEQMIGPLFQVIVQTEDVVKLSSFYIDVLNMELIHPSNLGSIGSDTFVRLKSNKGAYLAIHTGRPSNTRISFYVQDLEATASKLKDSGLKLGEIRNPAPGIKVLDCMDPDGNNIHFETHENQLDF